MSLDAELLEKIHLDKLNIKMNEEKNVEPNDPPLFLDFGKALDALKAKSKVTRLSWHSESQYVEMQCPDVNSKMTVPYLYLNHAWGYRAPWTPSQDDIFADDWYIVG